LASTTGSRDIIPPTGGRAPGTCLGLRFFLPRQTRSPHQGRHLADDAGLSTWRKSPSAISISSAICRTRLKGSIFAIIKKQSCPIGHTHRLCDIWLDTGVFDISSGLVRPARNVTLFKELRSRFADRQFLSLTHNRVGSSCGATACFKSFDGRFASVRAACYFEICRFCLCHRHGFGAQRSGRRYNFVLHKRIRHLAADKRLHLV